MYVQNPSLLVLTLDQQELPYTMSGNINKEINGTSLISVPDGGAILTLRNPAENNSDVTIEAQSSNVEPVSRLVIVRLCPIR